MSEDESKPAHLIPGTAEHAHHERETRREKRERMLFIVPVVSALISLGCGGIAYHFGQPQLDLVKKQLVDYDSDSKTKDEALRAIQAQVEEMRTANTDRAKQIATMERQVNALLDGNTNTRRQADILEQIAKIEIMTQQAEQRSKHQAEKEKVAHVHLDEPALHTPDAENKWITFNLTLTNDSNYIADDVGIRSNAKIIDRPPSMLPVDIADFPEESCKGQNDWFMLEPISPQQVGSRYLKKTFEEIQFKELINGEKVMILGGCYKYRVKDKIINVPWCRMVAYIPNEHSRRDSHPCKGSES